MELTKQEWFELLDRIRNSNFIELVTDAECGQLSALSCLCSPQLRLAYEYLKQGLTTQELEALFKTICPCVVRPTQPTAVVPTGLTIPASLPPTPVSPPPPPPTEPKVCTPGLPAEGSITAYVLSKGGTP